MQHYSKKVSKKKSLEPGAKYNARVSTVKNDYTFIQTEQDNIRGIISNAEFLEEGTELVPGNFTPYIFFAKITETTTSLLH